MTELNGEDGWSIKDCRFGNKLLVASSYRNKSHRLTVWKLLSPTNIKLMTQLMFTEPITLFCRTLNDYIVLFIVKSAQLTLSWVTFYFISVKTFVIERTLYLKTKNASYMDGLLIFHDHKDQLRCATNFQVFNFQLF